jgi:hypothetical protein
MLDAAVDRLKMSGILGRMEVRSMEAEPRKLKISSIRQSSDDEGPQGSTSQASKLGHASNEEGNSPYPGKEYLYGYPQFDSSSDALPPRKTRWLGPGPNHSGSGISYEGDLPELRHKLSTERVDRYVARPLGDELNQPTGNEMKQPMGFEPDHTFLYDGSNSLKRPQHLGDNCQLANTTTKRADARRRLLEAAFKEFGYYEPDLSARPSRSDRHKQRHRTSRSRKEYGELRRTDDSNKSAPLQPRHSRTYEEFSGGSADLTSSKMLPKDINKSISGPKDPVHVTHVGFDAYDGHFYVSGSADSEYR